MSVESDLKELLRDHLASKSELKKRLKALEKDSHPPVRDWDDLEERISKIELKQEWMARAIGKLLYG